MPWMIKRSGSVLTVVSSSAWSKASTRDAVSERETHTHASLPRRYFERNLEWLHDQLGDEDDDYFLFDCPGECTAN